MGDSNDHAFRNSLSCNLTIKEEIPDYDTQTSCSISQNDGSLLPSTTSSTEKQGSAVRLLALKNAYELKLEMHRLLKDDVSKLKSLYKKNLETQDLIKNLVKEESAARIENGKTPNHMKAISLFAAPYFRDVKRMIPPFNEDTKIKRKKADINAYLKPPKPWTQRENQKILDGVTEFALMSALKPHKIKRDYLKSKMKDKELLDFEIKILEKQLSATEKKIKAISNRPLQDLLTELQGNIDWMQISAVNMEGNRLPEECEIMWNNYLNFAINKEAFSKEEDDKLQDLAEDNNERDWDLIANSLQTSRTPIQCFERYQTRLSRTLKKKFWTKVEDDRLRDLVNQLKYGDVIPWNRVSMLMEGRTRQQCINRYDRSISQTYKCGPWTPEEDGLLIACYHKFGTHWAKMKSFYKRRSTYAIRERYCNALDPTLKAGLLWSNEEDRLLILCIKQYGYGKWSKICKKIPGRTDNMCLNRAARLLEYSSEYFSRKGIEYDTGIYDPEMYAKILRPIPRPRNFCTRAKAKPFRENAIATLLKVIEKVVPDVKVEAKDLSEVDFHWISSENLYQVSEELHSMVILKELKTPPSRLPFTRYVKKPALLRKREYDEVSIEECPPSPEKQLPLKEKDWLDSVLDIMLKMTGAIIKPKVKRRPQEFSSREYAEISLYKAYLYKQFGCSAVCDNDDNIENVTFTGIDFSETLQTVVSYFVQPPIYENQFIVLAPNLTTLGGMEAAEVTEDRLLSMSECVFHSKNYMDYICERRESCPKCIQCMSKDDELHTTVSTAFVISNLKNKHFIVNETMETSAYIESAATEKCVEDCSCASLEESRNSVQLLRKRFMALFLWPAFLAATNFSTEQDNILCTEPIKANNYFWHTIQPTQNPLTRKYREKQKGKIVPKTEPTEDFELPPPSDILVSQNELPEQPNNGDSTTSHAPQIAATRVKKTCVKRKREYPEVLRRSKRTCVLRRTSFAIL